MTSASASEHGGAGSQTLSRGIRILELLAARDEPASIPELVAALGLHRSIVYRLVRTLEQHRLVARDARGAIVLGAGLASLAARVDGDLQTVAMPELRRAAEAIGATCFLVVLDAAEVVTLVSAEPSRSKVTVAEHPGTRHPLGVGAPGRAVLIQLPRSEWPAGLDAAHIAATEAVGDAGYATSFGEVIPGLRAVAVPLAIRGRGPMALACVYVSTSFEPVDIAAELAAAAVSVATALGR